MVELFLQGDRLGMCEHGGIARCKYRKIFLRDIQQQSVLRRRQCQCRLFTLELGGAKTEEQLRPIERLRQLRAVQPPREGVAALVDETGIEGQIVGLEVTMISGVDRESTRLKLSDSCA